MADPSMPLMYWPALMVGAYLLGSIPFSQVMARINGVDLRTVGSGNVGAGNLKREVGTAWAVVAALLDGLKGTAPVVLALEMGLGPGSSGLAGIAAVVGHCWSIFMKGRSGRGLATSAGLVLGLYWPYLIWTSGWAMVGSWKIGGGLAGFLGWALLPIVSVSLARPATESLMLALLALILMARRVQGNPGGERGTRAAMTRILYDTDREADPVGDAIEGPLTS